MSHLRKRLKSLVVLLLCATLSGYGAEYSAPSTGKIYRIWNARYGNVMYETSTHTLNTKSYAVAATSQTDFSDLFLLESKPGVTGGYTLRNVATGRYVQSVSANETPYTTGYTPMTVQIKLNAQHNTDSAQLKPCYNLFLAGSSTFCLHEAQDMRRVVRWQPTTSDAQNYGSEWRLEEVVKTDEMTASLKNTEKLHTGVYRIINDKRHDGSDWYAYQNGSNGLFIQGTKATSGYDQLFLLRYTADDKYSIQSLTSGGYVQTVESNEVAYNTGFSPHGFNIAPWTRDNSHTYYNIFNVSASDGWGWHANRDDKIVRWTPSTASTATASEWKLERVDSISDESLKNQLAKAMGASTPQAGRYYHVVSLEYGRVMVSNYVTGRVNTGAEDNGQYLQAWQLVDLGNGYCTLKNAVTGQYLTNVYRQSAYYFTSNDQPTQGFKLSANTADPYTLAFELKERNDTTWGVHCAESQGYDAVRWHTGGGGNRWMFKEITPDQTALSAQQAAYRHIKDLEANLGNYQTTLLTYFADSAMTQLKPAYKQMATAELRSQLVASSLPDELVNMTLKVKDSTWTRYQSGHNWEKQFRIADYEPFSDYTRWSERMGIGYQMGSMFGPTGITVKKDSVVFIFVNDVPANSKMECEIIPLGTKNGTITTLRKGMNIVTAGTDGNLFMRYIADTYDTTKATTLASFPMVRVHIEGGEVCGYFDVVKGMTNTDWANMVSDGLVTNSRSFDMRTKNVVIHADAQHVKTGCSANDIVEMLGVWEFIVSHEQALMGFREKWKDRCNCVMNATAVASGLYASTGGTYYGYYAWPNELVKYSVLNTGAGKLWAPGHEFGHNHQKLINMAGMTEVSNNLFSNQILFEYGKSTSRGGGQESAVSTLARKHTTKTFWPDYGTWGCTQMFYKLYLYYHAAKNDTTFFPRLFAALQEHPMTRRAMHSGKTYGDEDYLRFALTCAKVANEDLSDFFEYYGFFVPVTNRFIGDYSNYNMTTTQAMIDSVKTEMRKLPKTAASQNLIFISDHIRKSPSIAKDAKPGEMRQDYTGEDAVGKQGEFGQWEDFTRGKQLAPQGTLSYAVLNADSSITYHVDNTNYGVVGFKVYDQRDSLVYIANTKTFTVPAAVAKACGLKPIVKLAGANGRDLTVSKGENILGAAADNKAFKVSNDSTAYWYYLQFAASGNVLASNGDGANAVTAVAKATKGDSQLWKAVWSDTTQTHYYLVNKAGLRLKLNNGSNKSQARFVTSSTEGTPLVLFRSNNTEFAGCYELSTDSTAANAMNQVGQLAAGQDVGVWDKGNRNNVLRYVAEDDMAFAASLPKSSTAANPVWYYIQFQSRGLVLASNGKGAPTVLAGSSTKSGDSQLWRFERQPNGKYTIFNKQGQQLYVTTSSDSDRHHQVNAGTPTTATTEFWITEDFVNGTGFEISTDTTNAKNYFNQFRGANVDNNIALWTRGDEGNCVQFIPEGELVQVTGAASLNSAHKYTLWYNKPATTWMTSCLPIGNGQFGATVMGQIVNDNVQFNDKTLWSGKLGSLTGNPSYGYYLNFGSLNIHTDNAGDVTDYARYLDINEAVAGVKYSMNGVNYTRSYIASYPDSIVVIRYEASRDSMINATLTLADANGSNARYTIVGGQGKITFAGNIARQNDSGAATPESYMAEARVVVAGGVISSQGQNIKVSGANTMTVYLRGITNYDPSAAEYVSDRSLIEPRLTSIVDRAVGKKYDALLTAHKNDYKHYFDRCQLTLADAVATTTDSLISRYALNQDDNLFLEELYFNYGRYLLISSSRGVTLPANLQGIWNNRNQAPWHSDIHADINVQMNYWPAEPTNLSELHAPMTDWIYREAVVKPQWQANARSIGHVNKGWTLTTENNIYGSGSTWMSNYTIANAWLTSHLWQHFEYTQDTTFLRTKAFPVMKGCTDYWLEKLVKNAADGTYECPNEYSPEHGPDRENATAHSQQLVWDLFNSTLKAISKLGLANAGVDSAYVKKLQNRFDSLDTGCHTEVIDGKTYLREWKTTPQNTYSDWKSHRHISHLMGLYPLSQIGKEANDSIFRAAKNSLYARGLTGTGWSLGHKLNLMARAYDGENCHALIKNALRQTWQTTINMGNNGGIYENLWDAHSPFQIDGNFGYTSGVAEMLLQSRFGKLEILPALPARHWKSGSVKGLRAVGNFTVDITWQDTIATQLAVTSGSGLPCTVVYKDAKRFKVTTSAGGNVGVTVKSDNEITFPTTKNTVYYLDMNMAGDTTATRMRQSDFQVVKVSDEETSSEWAPAEQALDANAASFWHSRYNGSETAYPHVFTLRHLVNGGISSVKLTNLRETKYHAKFVTIEQSADGKAWETVANHKLLNRADSNVVRFDKMASQPFLRLTFEQGYNGSNLMTLNDIQFYGTVAQADSLYKLPLAYVATSDEETTQESSPARNAVDGNEATLWHSRYNRTTAYPHSITLMNSTRDALKYIRLVQRPDNSAYSHTKYDAAEVVVYAGASKDTLSAVDTLRIPFYSTATVALKKPVTDKFVKLVFTHSQERGSNFLAIHEISGYANEMPFTMNRYGYATFFHNHAVTVPEGMEATTVKFENDRFRYDYEYRAGATIPANTGVMVKAAPGDYRFVYSADDVDAPTGNYMKGSVNDTVFSGEGKYYKLTFNRQHDLNSLGFYWDNEDGTRMVNPAHKGYVLLPASIASKLASFYPIDGSATTGLNSLVIEEKPADIYDLSGRYVGQDILKLPRGVYIRKGKKIIIK